MIAQKNNVLTLVTFAACVLYAVAYFYLSSKPEEKQPPVYELNKTIQYSFNVKNESNKVAEDVVFSVYAPVSQTSTQRVKNIKASHQYELEKDSYQNQVMHFNLGKLAPYEARVVRIRAELQHAEQANELENANSESFVAAEKYIESGHPKMLVRAERLQKDSQVKSVKSIYQFSSSRIEYKGYIAEDRGALYAMQKRRGDCTEYAYLVSALSRAMNIPARVVGGYVYDSNATFKARDYHNWAEVYYDNKWHIVDAQKKNFASKQSHYIAMRIITPESEAILGNSHQFAYSNSNISISM